MPLGSIGRRGEEEKIITNIYIAPTLCQMLLTKHFMYTTSFSHDKTLLGYVYLPLTL